MDQPIKKLQGFPEKERKIWLSTPSNKFESNIALSGVDSKKINGILSFETYFELLNIPIPSRLEIMLERFEEEKLIIKSGKLYNITNLGAILFAKVKGKRGG